MQNFFHPATHKTPRVSLNAEKGELSIEGVLIPEDTILFFRPIFEWMESYLTNPPKQKTTLTMGLEYFNTSSAKSILDLFNFMGRISNGGNEIEINWLYEDDDDDMMEVGEDYQNMVEKVKINLVPVERLDLPVLEK